MCDRKDIILAVDYHAENGHGSNEGNTFSGPFMHRNIRNRL
jgi:hypothetical protein